MSSSKKKSQNKTKKIIQNWKIKKKEKKRSPQKIQTNVLLECDRTCLVFHSTPPNASHYFVHRTINRDFKMAGFCLVDRPTQLIHIRISICWVRPILLSIPLTPRNASHCLLQHWIDLLLGQSAFWSKVQKYFEPLGHRTLYSKVERWIIQCQICSSGAAWPNGFTKIFFC